MAWALVLQDLQGKEKRQFPLEHEKILLTKTSSGWFPTPKDVGNADEEALGLMTIKSWGVSLEARQNVLEILPHHQPTEGLPVGSSPDAYMLQPSTKDYSQIMILREKDVVRSLLVPNSQIVLIRGAGTQVQVSSSISESHAPISNEADDAIDAGDVTEEDDDEDLDQPSKTDLSMSRSTPLPSAARTEVVQETPTANRSMAMLPASEIPVTETFSTAPTGRDSVYDIKHLGSDEASPSHAKKEVLQDRRRHPIVEIKAKRSSPSAEEEKKEDIDDDNEIEVSTPPPAKRRKTEDIEAPSTKGKSKTRGTNNAVQEGTPSRTSSRSSPRSSAVQDEYDEPELPCVAFSNSSILPGSQFLKFLKKNRGSVTEKVNEHCNVLCVKTGPLLKTMKLLQSIAQGIPIVTDQWLIDSSRAHRFLRLAPYTPQNVAQEAEWKYSLAAIWGVPQTSLFKGYTFVFTPALKTLYKDFTEIQKVCEAVGAKDAVSRVPTVADYRNKMTIVLADAPEAGMGDGPKFSKDLLTRSILRGEVDLESDEFRLGGSGDETAGDESAATPATKAKKKKGRAKKA